MDNRFTLKIAGSAGEGIMTTGELWSKTLMSAGQHVFDYAEYPSLIRGGHNTIQITSSLHSVFGTHYDVNLLIALNKESILMHNSELVAGAGIIYDGYKNRFDANQINKQGFQAISVPLFALARKDYGKVVTINNVALGAAVYLAGVDFSILEETIKTVFARKGEKVQQLNVLSAKAGYDYVQKKYQPLAKISVQKSGQAKMLINGNEALSLGAIRGGLQFYVSYPMTPSSSILSTLAKLGPRYNIIVKQPEDEIAAINMAIGAGFMGIRAMTGTSGGGFALMNEGFGLAGITETPVVIVEGMRPGPATGLPTWSDQGDLKYVLNAAQGEFPRIVLAPGDIQECFFETIRALNLAEKYQTPVIILTDKFLAESHSSILPFDDSKVKIDGGKLLTQSDLDRIKNFKRYQVSDDGVSPRSVPGMENGIFVANSDEHEEHGFSEESSVNRITQTDKRMRKLKSAKSDMPKPTLFGPKKADVTLIGFGSTKMSILESLTLLKERGNSRVNYLHICAISPFPSEEVLSLLSQSKRTICIENNATAQLAHVIREQTGFSVHESLLKYDGRPFFPHEIIENIESS